MRALFALPGLLLTVLAVDPPLFAEVSGERADLSQVQSRFSWETFKTSDQQAARRLSPVPEEVYAEAFFAAQKVHDKWAAESKLAPTQVASGPKPLTQEPIPSLSSSVSPPVLEEEKPKPPSMFDALHHEFSGSVAQESRFFWERPQASGQRGDFDSSLSAQPELYLEWDDGDQSVTFVPFARWDQHDNQRTHFDIREAFWLRVWENWELSFGLRKVFWGVTESQHLVDIINQTDGVENPDGEDKLGQPMVKVDWIQDWGTLEFFLMPYFRERTFGGRKGRLRPIPIVDEDNPVYESGAQQAHLDWALRYSRSFGMFDAGLSHFMGTSREPRLELGTDVLGGTARIPFYDVIHQTGLDLQLTAGDWLWKLEGIWREGFGNSFAAGVGGFEYTQVGILGTPADLGLLSEYHIDERGDKATSALDNDLFGAFRLTLNDVQSTELLAGATVDLETRALFLNLEASRRLTDHLKLSLEVRLLSNIPGTDPLVFALRDDYVQMELAYYF